VFGDISGWDDPVHTGPVLAGFVAAGHWTERSGQSLDTHTLAEELGPAPRN
jgi:hypothetical protein